MNHQLFNLYAEMTAEINADVKRLIENTSRQDNPNRKYLGFLNDNLYMKSAQVHNFLEDLPQLIQEEITAAFNRGREVEKRKAANGKFLKSQPQHREYLRAESINRAATTWNF
jgi:hypothetical protein